jgi:hypothetical protein
MTVAVTHVNEYTGPVIDKADYISDGETSMNVLKKSPKYLPVHSDSMIQSASA